MNLGSTAMGNTACLTLVLEQHVVEVTADTARIILATQNLPSNTRQPYRYSARSLFIIPYRTLSHTSETSF